MKDDDTLKPLSFQRADAIVTAILKYASYLSAISIIAIMFVAFFNVLGEKILRSGIPASTEIIQYLHVPLVFLAAGFVTLDRGHVTIDLLSTRFPKRIQKIVTTIGFIMGAGITGFIGCRGVVQMGRFYRSNIMSSVTGAGFVKWPFALLFVIGLFLLSFSFIWAAVRMHQTKNEPVSESGKG